MVRLTPGQCVSPRSGCPPITPYASPALTQILASIATAGSAILEKGWLLSSWDTQALLGVFFESRLPGWTAIRIFTAVLHSHRFLARGDNWGFISWMGLVVGATVILPVKAGAIEQFLGGNLFAWIVVRAIGHAELVLIILIAFGGGLYGFLGFMIASMSMVAIQETAETQGGFSLEALMSYIYGLHQPHGKPVPDPDS